MAVFTVRPAELRDAEALGVLGPQTFLEAFGKDLPRPFSEARMAVVYSPERLAEDLSDPHQAWFLAECRRRVVGFATLKEGPAPTCVRGAAPVELGRIYVRASWLGRGPGPALMDAAMAEAQRRGARTLWLQAWAGNVRALAFYRARGFTTRGSVDIVFGGLTLTHLILARRLR